MSFFKSPWFDAITEAHLSLLVWRQKIEEAQQPQTDIFLKK